MNLIMPLNNNIMNEIIVCGKQRAEKYRDWHILYQKLMAKRLYRKEKKNVKTTCLPQLNFLFKRFLNIKYDRVGYKIYMECSQGKHRADSMLGGK